MEPSAVDGTAGTAGDAPGVEAVVVAALECITGLGAIDPEAAAITLDAVPPTARPMWFPAGIREVPASLADLLPPLPAEEEEDDDDEGGD